MDMEDEKLVIKEVSSDEVYRIFTMESESMIWFFKIVYSRHVV